MKRCPSRGDLGSGTKGWRFATRCFAWRVSGLVLLLATALPAAAETVVETFDSPGEGEFTVPAGVTEITVEAWGGGGSGGNASGNNQQTGGGGAGAYARSVLSVQPDDDFDLEVGGGASPADAGGGVSSFGDGPAVEAAAGQSVAENISAGGDGGQASESAGDVTASGGDGSGGIGSGNSRSGGDGGDAPDGTTITGGNGGAGGAEGEDGTAGESPGGGGGGAATTTGGGPPGGGNKEQSGGAGANGLVRITYEKPVLRFEQQPTTTETGATIDPSVVVRLEDSDGNLATNFEGNVSIAIANNPGGGNLNGTTTVEADSGRATFPNLSIDAPGQGYTLEATADVAEPAVSDSFDIVSNTVVISGQVRQLGEGEPGVTVAQADGNSVTTNDNGNYSITVAEDSDVTLTAQKDGLVFCPANRSISVRDMDRPGAGFRAFPDGSPVNAGSGGDAIYKEPNDGDIVHVFCRPGSGQFTPPENVSEVEALVVGGGGGGGAPLHFTSAGGGGGGAGGLIRETAFAVSGSVDVTVGSGGERGDSPGDPSPGGNGEDSVFGTLTAIGGGGGSGDNEAGSDGGSGGGSRGEPGSESTQPNPGFGNRGGVHVGTGRDPGLDRAATGGGGADERGEDLDGEDGEDGGAGGAGLAFSTSGADVAYAGGGGGGAADNRSDDPGAPGEGGDGGGGDGGRSGVPPTPGFPGTGGGGGGGNNAVPGADGGSGIVVVRYPEPEPVLTCQAREFDSELGPEWETEAVSGSFGEPRAVDGVLRLTDATNDVSTRATILDKLPWDQNRVEVTFTYFAYGGSTDSGDGGDADGIAVTFSDASVTPSPGGFGGSLGYAQRETPQQVDGFNGGWLGIGLDEFGNYSSATEGRVGGDGFTPDGVAIRGDGSGQSGYEYIAGTDSLDDPLSNPTVADRSSLTPDRYRIVVDTTEEGTALVTVERDTTGTGDNFVTLLEEDVAGEQDTAPPDEVFLSFTGATGGETNFHEIDFLEVCANRGIEAAVDRYAVTGPGQALTCTTSTVTIEARDSDGDPIAPDAGTVLTLGSDTGRGTWVSLGSEGGDLRDSTTGDGAGEYEFPGDEASVDVGLDHPDIETDPEEVVIDVDDGSASGSSDPITVSRAGFRFLDDDTGTGSDIVSPQIADKPSNQGFGQSTIELQALEATDGDPTTCQGVFDDGDVVTVDMGAECRDPSACADTGPDLAVSGTPIATSDDNGDADAPGGFTGVDLEFGPESKAAIPLRYADAGSMRLYARYEIQTTQDDGTTIGSGEFLRGMSNSFLVRPFGFDIEAIDNPSASNSGGAVYEDAGADFDVRVTAVGWASGDDTEDNDGSNGPDGIPDGYAADANDVADNADLSDNNARLPNFGNETSAEEVTLGAGSWKPSPANGAANGTLSGDTPISSSAFANPANAAAGAARVTVAYDEVGIAELRADLTDGRYQDSDRNVPGRSPRGVGRFIPDRFVVSDNNPGFRDGTDIGAMWDASFTYMGQAFTYSDGHEPLLTVEAVNDGGNTTANYGGRGTSEDFWKLDTPARDYSDATAADTQADFVVDKGSAARTWDGTRADYDGRGTLRIRGKRPTIAGDYFVFARVGAQDDETRQTPFDALIDLTLPASGLTDPDGVCYQQDATGGCIDFTIDGDGADNEDESNREPMGSVATTELRYGRLVLESANGSEIAPIALPLRAEYWAKADTDADAGWRVNSDDSETTLDLAAQVDVTNDDTTKSGTSDIALADARNGGATELATNTADPVELVDGQANLIFAAPGENNTGWAAAIGKPRPVCESDPDCDLPIERRYLQYDWETDGDPSDGQVDDDPRGRATFGIFTGPASRVLLREIPPR